LARYGGEEFLLLLSATDARAARGLSRSAEFFLAVASLCADLENLRGKR
jgi:GGDEF domain-containing protein